MDDRNFELAEDLINPSYARLGQNSINKRQKMMKELLSQRQLPTEGFDDLTIRYILDTLALMDSNNFDGKVGVGQRQSRIYSKIVAERHFFMGHGIGRSGDIMANQPKAAGSSLILQLTKYLTVSALHQLNYSFVKDVLPLPLATGMSLTLGLLTLHELRPQKKYIIWSRIDQKTCLKSIATANLIPIVVQLKLEGDGLVTDTHSIEQKIKEVGPQNVLAIMSTTSCFAPRLPDRVDEISLIAKKYGVYHIVNNAYGIWCSKIAHTIKQGYTKRQCTLVVQSTDKNFMVPVGGSFIFCQDQSLLQKISAKYPGRASGSPIVDLFITLLSMGKSTIQKLKIQRKKYFQHMFQKAQDFAKKHGCQVLSTPSNTISIGMYLGDLKDEAEVTKLGAILYSKRVMGHRILAKTQKLSKVAGKQFANYGSHCEDYPFLPYITFACAVGTQMEEINLFFDRFTVSWKQLKEKITKKQQKTKKQEKQKIEQQSQNGTKEEEAQKIEEKVQTTQQAVKEIEKEEAKPQEKLLKKESQKVD